MTSIDSSALLGYYASQRPLSAQTLAAAKALTDSRNGIAKVVPPWDSSIKQPAQAQGDADATSAKPFIDLSKANQIHGSDASAKSAQDTQKLFALYQAVNRLAYLASMGGRDGMLDGQLAGLDRRFQNGLSEVQDFLSTQNFNNLTLLAGQKTATITSKATVPLSETSYAGGFVVKGKALFQPVPGLSASDSFTIAVSKGGTTTNVAIDLSQVSGPLTLDNVTAYINQQLSAAGADTRFKRVALSTDIPKSVDQSKPYDVMDYESFGLQITPAPSEKVTLSSAAAEPALYVSGNTGVAAKGDQTGRLIKLVGVGTDPQSEFNSAIAPDSGNSTALATVVDPNGSVYVVGGTTGSMGGQMEKGDSDVYLTKYDSAGTVQWTRLLGAQSNAQAYALSLDPTGGVVVAGNTDSLLTQTAIGGNTDSFVAKYTADGTESWLHQVSPIANDSGLAVTVDATGNVYVGGKVTGTIAAGQTNAGKDDATVTKLDSKGKIVWRQQFGTSGNDSMAATGMTSDGGLVVASVENGHAIVRKFAGGDASQAPLWQQDLGDLANGAIGGLAISGNDIYVSGTSGNAALNAPVANASAGGTDAFVFKLNDAGASVSAGYVSYVGTGSSDKGAGLAVSNGMVYLTGTTRGQFAGQKQSFANAENMFVAALNSDGTQNWVRQYGGVEGQSQGTGIAVDASGASVLDKLGLPKGAIALTQSVNLTTQTTLRAGDSFKIKVMGRTTRQFTITIGKDETMSSLATKINAAIGANGRAKVTYTANGGALKLDVKEGVHMELASGPANFDALKGLGIAPSVLVKEADDAANSNGTTQKKIFGLGIPPDMDLTSKKDANDTRAKLLNVLSAIRNTYRTATAQASSSAATNTASGPAPAYLTSQIANYSLALSAMSSRPGGGSSTLGLF